MEDGSSNEHSKECTHLVNTTPITSFTCIDGLCEVY